MSTLLKIYCPKCGQPIEGEEEAFSSVVSCPSCLHYFKAKADDKSPEPWTPEEKKLLAVPHSQRIRDRAGHFWTVAITIGAFAALALLIGAGARMETDTIGEHSQLDFSNAALSVGWFLLKISFACYLISQVIHIRANTEK